MSAIAIPFRKGRTEKKKVLPEPLVKPYKHPIKWTGQKLHLGLAAVVGAHIGTLIIVALYYLLFETYAPFTNEWHRLISDDNLRHTIRGVGEGLLGGTLGQVLIFNAFKKHRQPMASKWLDGWKTVFYLPLILIAAIPGFVLGFWVVHLVHHGDTFITHADYLQKATTDNWDQKVVGLFASFFMARFFIKALAWDAQGWFAERRACLGKSPRFYQTPVFQARVNYLSKQVYTDKSTTEHATVKSFEHNSAINVVMLLAVFVGLCLAGFGFYVLDFIAK